MEAAKKSNVDFLERLRAETEIRDLLCRYCRAADRKDFDAFRQLYHPDAYDEHGLYTGGVEGLIAWCKHRHDSLSILQSTHFIGNCLIEVEGERAFGETYAIVTQHAPAPDGQGYMRNMVGVRYVDTFERRAGEWRIARRVLAYEWYDKTPVAEILPPGPEWLPARRSKEDPVYTERALMASAS